MGKRRLRCDDGPWRPMTFTVGEVRRMSMAASGAFGVCPGLVFGLVGQYMRNGPRISHHRFCSGAVGRWAGEDTWRVGRRWARVTAGG